MPEPKRWPGPDAPRTEVDAFLAANTPPVSEEPAHEAPPVENGPSIVCSACGVVRIKLLGPPFCVGCQAVINTVAG